MLKKTHLLAISICLSIILHAYLTNSYFQVHYGDGGSANAICNVGEKFNCEAVTASNYSQFLGVPLATWGLGLNLTLLLLLLGFILSDSFKKQWLGALQLMVIASAVGSLVMAFVSLSFLTVYCLFCIILYILSFLQVFLVFKLPDIESFKSNFTELLNVKTTPYGVYIVLALFPVVSAFVGAKMKRDFGGDRFDKQVSALIQSWKEETNVVTFGNTPATLTKLNSQSSADFEIVEFADFLCGHCKKASKTIKTFLVGHSANFRFYTFPLDKTCRTLDNTLTGPSCYLAKTAYCADKQSKGWEAHDWIFENQNKLMTSIDNVKSSIVKMSTDLGLDQASLESCIEDEQTHKAIVTQSEFAQNLNITGTPTIYVNGKKLKGGQILDVLKKAYEISH